MTGKNRAFAYQTTSY